MVIPIICEWCKEKVSTINTNGYCRKCWNKDEDGKWVRKIIKPKYCDKCNKEQNHVLYPMKDYNKYECMVCKNIFNLKKK